LRQANPARNNNQRNNPNSPRNNPARQPGLQRQNGLPQQQRQGLPQPGVQRPSVQPGAPAVVRPGLQNRPALQQRRPPAPKGKPPPSKPKH
jgi:hypothetical protein